MRNDADHFDPFRLRRAKTGEDTFSHGRFVGKGFGREKLVDNHYFSSRRIVRLGERTTCDDRRTDRFKVSREHDLPISRLKLARVRKRLSHTPPERTESARERERSGGRHAFDSRQRLQSAAKIANESGALLRLPGAGAEQPECKNIFR